MLFDSLKSSTTKNRLRGTVALVTGGASGIGRALGRQLADFGVRVYLADRNADALQSTLEHLASVPVGTPPSGTVVNVADAQAVESWVADVWQRERRIDFLFNNAGIGITGEVRDMDLEAWNRIIDVNLRGVVHGIQSVYPHMIEQGFGHIANTACVAGLVPFPMSAAYCATKHAVVGLSASLRGEAARLGVKVSVICPGIVRTEMFDHIEYIRVDKELLINKLSPALVPVDRCAQAILRGVLANRAIITINLHAKAAWWTYRLAPRSMLAVVGRTFRFMGGRLRADRPAKTQTGTHHET